MATIDWTNVEEAERSGSLEGYKVALLEADKILEGRLREERVPGKTAADRLRSLELHLTRPKEARQAVGFVQRMRTGDTPPLTKERAQDFLQAYRQAVTDVTEYGQQHNQWRNRLKLALGVIKGQQRRVLQILAWAAGASLLVLFLADTGLGQDLVQGVVDLVRAVARLVLLTLLVAALLAGLVIATAVTLTRDRAKVTTDEDESAPHHD